MAYFAVSYQLNKQKNYKPLWDEMTHLGAHKAMRDFYLLDVNLETAEQMRNHLTRPIHEAAAPGWSGIDLSVAT